MRTSALGRIAVRRPPTRPDGDEAFVLETASEYRRRLVDVYQRRHEETVKIRDAHFPALWAAMVRRELAAARIYAIERRIKAFHSEVRDRNAVSPKDRESLQREREAMRDAKSSCAEQGRVWKLMFRAHSDWWQRLVDWKNVKSRDKRRVLYDALPWPDSLAAYVAALNDAGRTYDVADLNLEALLAYGREWVRSDWEERELDAEFADALHPSIRKEIKESSAPKLSKTGPGIRYRYGRTPEDRGWEKLSLHFAGGLTVADALAGKNSQLQLSQYGPTLYGVRQQVGTSVAPRWLNYAISDASLSPQQRIMRWSRVTRQRRTRGGRFVYRRYVVPVCADLPLRETGVGMCAYKLCWTRTGDGVLVARLWGEGLHERLVVPEWLLARIGAVATLQSACDDLANAQLLGRGAATGRRQGVEALSDYVRENPDDDRSASLLDDCHRRLQTATRGAESARRCVEEIYKVTAARLRRMFASVHHDSIDLAKLKRYDSRDLLRVDKVPLKSREILHAVSPGKLRLWLKQCGLAASDEAPPEPPQDARETDVIMSYVRSLGIKTGYAGRDERRRSRKNSAVRAG